MCAGRSNRGMIGSQGIAPNAQGRTPLPRTVTFATAVALTLWCAARALVVDALAGPLERVEFAGAILQGAVIPGERIQGYLAKPEGAGPFPAVIGLHGCGGLLDATKRRLADELVGWGYVVLLVDSFATRGIVHACSGGIPDISGKRRSDAYGALAFLAGQAFVDPHRVAAVGFSQGGWVSLMVADEISFELFARPSNLRFRAAIALYPVCSAAGGSPVIPTLILIGALDDWTPAADCVDKIEAWGTDGPPIELVVYPGVHHSFYYPELQPGRKIFGHWLEYNEEAATDAIRRMQEFLKRHLD
jgi:dienelactone hydrolase